MTAGKIEWLRGRVDEQGCGRGITPVTLLFLLTTGATGAAGTTGPDLRITNGTSLSNGPFQLTGPNLPYDSYTGDTTHRFYQMWQQSDCSIHNAKPGNPTGCLNDLYPFVITTYAGAGDKRAAARWRFHYL